MTEIQLIEACKQAESFAQRLLYDNLVDGLFLLCLRYLPGRHDAEEVLSNTFVKGFKNITQFTYSGEGSVRAWFSKIAVNECLMFLRKKRQLNIPLNDEIHVIHDDSSFAGIETLSVKEILNHIQNLPTGYRTVLNLYVFEERTHKEIAVLLDISENTSKSQLFKARAMLKQKLKANI